jgi:hypothetical protein
LIPVRGQNISLLYNVQTLSGAQVASYTCIMGTWGRVISLGLKRQGRQADDLPPPSTEIKNGGAVSPLLLALGTLLNKPRDTFTQIFNGEDVEGGEQYVTRNIM